MYNSQLFFVENPINRYSISPRQHLKPNPDGSVDRDRSLLDYRGRMAVQNI